MNRILPYLLAAASAAMPLVVDSALKGVALLSLAMLCMLSLWRASAAARHLVWLVAVLALLLVPVLSALLPGWRVLPEWVAVREGRATQPSAAPKNGTDVSDGTYQSYESPQTPAAHPPQVATAQPASTLPSVQPATAATPPPPVAEIVPAWRTRLPLLWAAGCGLLGLRLMGAHWLLRRASRAAERVTAGPLAEAMAAVAQQLGVRRRAGLLLDEKRTIPVVWGVFRPQLMLPAEAQTWGEDQLRSVLLHELAHIRRRDTVVQWLTQIACALHWFNPLVWFAAWRLHVERERACDDLVLASGVKPSSYAGHLLHVASQLSPARWTAACGLAMARKSSLEGRLLAVLSRNHNRRGVTRALAAATLLLGAVVAIPVSMLRAANERAAEEKPADTPDKKSADATAATMPLENKYAQGLYKIWQANARADGKIPGGLIGRLGAKVEEFVRINRDDASGAPYAKKVEPILPRFDASRDWPPDEAVALLNDLAALSDIPINTTQNAEDDIRIRTGEPLPADLKDAPWGEPSPEGLRVARPLDPRADSYPLGTALRSQILLHNAGKEPVLLRTKSWMQPGFEARDATGSAVNVDSTYWTTLGQVRTWRLAPGEYMEILTPGFGVGKGAGRDEWADVRVGSWLEATGLADITLSPGAVSVAVDDSRGSHIKTGEQLKLEVIRERLDRESPLPASAADREKIVRRVTKDIFGVDPTADEIAAFVSSKSGDPISALSNRLLQRAGIKAFVGDVKPGEITFRTTPADPDAANRPKVAIGPGRYTLGENVRLIIAGKPVAGRRTSDVEIRFWATNPKSEPPGRPHKIEVPDGFGTWAITCRPGTGILYVLTKGAVRKIDYSNPAQVKETPVTRGSSEDMPAEFREAVKRILTISNVPAEKITALIAASAPDESNFIDAEAHYQAQRWEPAIAAYDRCLEELPSGKNRAMALYHKGEVHRLLAADASLTEEKRKQHLRDSRDCYNAVLAATTVMSPAPGEHYARWTPSEPAACFASWRLASAAYAEGQASGDHGKYKEALGRFLIAWEIARNPQGEIGAIAARTTAGSLFMIGKCHLLLGEKELAKDSFQQVLGIENDKTFHDKARAELESLGAKTGSRSGEGTEPAGASAVQPKHEYAQSLFRKWQQFARTDGKIPGALIGLLAREMDNGMPQINDADVTAKLAALRPRCDPSHDWTPADVVALLDDITSISPLPVSGADTLLEFAEMRALKTGQPLPVGLTAAAWGPPAENGLRSAWLLEPRAEKYPLGSVLKARVLLHNSGRSPILLVTQTWHRDDTHKALDAGGAEIKIARKHYTGISRTATYLLEPGYYCEADGHGVAIGAGEYADETSTGRVGAVIEATEGDEVRFSTVVRLDVISWHPADAANLGKDPAQLRIDRVTSHVMRFAPLPADTENRTRILRRVTSDLTGIQPTKEELSAFLSDTTPDAAHNLIQRLAAKPQNESFVSPVGKLPTGETKFRVTAAAPKTVILKSGQRATTFSGRKFFYPTEFDPPQIPQTIPGNVNIVGDAVVSSVKPGAKLQPGTEEKLEWGEPVNGLRMALAWPPTLGEPAAGEVPDFFLAVQNVSASPVRLCTTTEAPDERRLTFSTDGRIQSRFVSSEPNGADVKLGPREVVFLRLFTEGAKDPENVPHGSMIASAVRQGPGVRLLADMEITRAPAGAWTGKLVTPWTRAGIGVEAPKNRKAQELFKVWLQHTRVNGKIPGGHIARLGDRVKEFVRANTGDKSGEPYAKRMESLVSRLDGARDWQPAEASTLLNDIAAVSDVPLSVMLEETAGGTIQYSLSLKPELENAPWGEALPNGLRVACLLEPRVAEHRLGTPLKMRILVHNAGKEPVVVRARTWHHIEPTARDAKGAEIKMESVTRYTRPPLVAYRLVPGRFIELASPGIGIGRYGYHDFKDADIASWIGVSESGEVTLTPGPVPLSDWNEVSVLDGEPRWWLDFITARLSVTTPLPADAAERTQLLQSTVRELFQSEATAEEIAAFVANRDPNALDSLAKRLAHRPGLTPFSGSLQSGPTKFRVTAADPNGAKPAATPAPAASPAPTGKPKASDAAKPGKEGR